MLSDLNYRGTNAATISDNAVSDCLDHDYVERLTQSLPTRQVVEGLLS